MESHYAERLQRLIKEKAGLHTPTVAATYDLEVQIEEAVKERISATTLQRFFGLVVSKSKVRESTLNILARYVGFTSWQQFCKQEQALLRESKHAQLEKIIHSQDDDTAKKLLFNLTEKALLTGNYDMVLSFIEDWPTPPDKNISLYRSKDTLMIRNLASLMMPLLLRHKAAAKYMFPRMTTMRAGQYYFFEYMVSERKQTYLQAIEDYYLPQVQPKQADYGLRDFTFANALVFQRYKEQNQKKKMIAAGYQWFGNVPPQAIEQLSHESEIMPWVRYHCNYLIWLYHQKKLQPSHIENVVILMTDRLDTNLTWWHLPVFIVGHLSKTLYHIKAHETLAELSAYFHSFLQQTEIALQQNSFINEHQQGYLSSQLAASYKHMNVVLNCINK